MKSLIDKIIEKLVQIKDEQHNPIARREFEIAIDEIIEIEKSADFEEVARVMIKHLGTQVEKYHPHHTVIITSTTCELVEGVKTVGKIMDYIVD